jgi:very-short-patch-repair endonuclease
MTQILFPSIEIIHHYRGRELEGLEIDIWIPSLKVGIEYQGVQHFTAIQHWGGADALKKRIQNDERKKQICKSLGYKLIEFKYDENLSEEKLRNKINAVLQITV